MFGDLCNQIYKNSVLSLFDYLSINEKNSVILFDVGECNGCKGSMLSYCI